MAATLNSYISQTQLLVHDTLGTLYTTTDITGYINLARSQLALEAECVRFNYGWDGLQMTGTFTSGLTSVTAVTYPTSFADTITNWVMVCPAVLTPGTTVANFNSVAQTITLSAPAVVSGTVSFIVGPPNNTSTLQEFYTIPNGNLTGGTPLVASTGVNGIIGVRTVTLNWGGAGGSNAYMLDYWDWTSYSAYLRFYGQNGLQGNPAVWTRYNNSVYLRPVPSQVYPMQWDCICSVVDMSSNTSPEAIPYPFTDAIPYYAAYMALLNAQRPADAQQMKERYEEYIKRARAFWQRTIIPTMYPDAGYR